MRIALTVWNGRIAPVFDVAGTLRLVRLQEDAVTEDILISVPPGSGMISRVASLVEQRIDILVCGAVSRPVHRMLADSGIEVHSFVAGYADDVLEALLKGNLEKQPFLMPGCGMGRNRRGCGRGAGNSRRGRNRAFEPEQKEV